MCKNVGRGGYCKFGGDTCIGLEDIARQREGGLEIAPSGARVKRYRKKTRGLKAPNAFVEYCTYNIISLYMQCMHAYMQ